MRILVFTSSVYGKDSTAEIHMKEILRHLSKTDEVVVIAQPKYHLNEIPGLMVRQVEMPTVFSGNIYVATFYKALLAANSLIAGAMILSSRKIDVLYARHGINSLCAIVLSAIFRKPLVFEMNGLWFDEANYYTLGKMSITRSLAWLLDMLSCRCSDGLVAVTDGIKKSIETLFHVPSSRIQVIPNGANVDLFRPIGQEAARQELRFDKDDKIVCFVGSIYQVSPWPGIHDLIKSAPRVLDKVPRAKFLIIGNGPLKDRWHSMVRELDLQHAFIFAGRVPYALVPTYINASDICVTPFRRRVNVDRGLSPLKLYEYLACGKAVVGSDISGIGDLLRSTDTGIAVPPEDPEALGNAISFLLNNETARARMAGNARRIAVANFSWESAARRISLVCAKASRDRIGQVQPLP
jgi:glycosyltransferase involved in cell wall biosynthesis